MGEASHIDADLDLLDALSSKKRTPAAPSVPCWCDWRVHIPSFHTLSFHPAYVCAAQFKLPFITSVAVDSSAAAKHCCTHTPVHAHVHALASIVCKVSAMFVWSFKPLFVWWELNYVMQEKC